MSFFIDHPDGWIGVPEYWPYPTTYAGTVESPQEWVDALVDELTRLESFSPEVRARVTTVLLLAAQRSMTAGSRMYAAFERWDGPAYLVEARVQPVGALGTGSLAEFAGAEDPQQLGAPFSEPFVTTSGLQGVRCYRYLPAAEHGVICGRLDYAFASEDSVLTITGGELDLVDFERLKIVTESLAATVSVEGD